MKTKIVKIQWGKYTNCVYTRREVCRSFVTHLYIYVYIMQSVVEHGWAERKVVVWETVTRTDKYINGWHTYARACS